MAATYADDTAFLTVADTATEATELMQAKLDLAEKVKYSGKQRKVNDFLIFSLINSLWQLFPRQPVRHHNPGNRTISVSPLIGDLPGSRIF